MILIKRVDSSDLQFQGLVNKLDAELSIENGDQDAFYSQYNDIESLEHCVIALNGDTAVGSGAMKQFDETTVEIKRMYVETNQRGQGISKLVLREIEVWAKELGYINCVLETGKFLTTAVGLYTAQGYEVIANYAPYTNTETSVCFKKSI